VRRTVLRGEDSAADLVPGAALHERRRSDVADSAQRAGEGHPCEGERDDATTVPITPANNAAETQAADPVSP
jgi:hypothetical protein